MRSVMVPFLSQLNSLFFHCNVCIDLLALSLCISDWLLNYILFNDLGSYGGNQGKIRQIKGRS